INGAEDNAAPASSDWTLAIDEDETYTFTVSDFPFTDTDTGDALDHVTITSLPSNGVLTYNGTAITGPLPSGGLVVSASDITSGLLTYTPGEHEPTDDTDPSTPINDGTGYADFTFTVSDGVEDSGSQTTTINVTPVADTPILNASLGNPTANYEAAVSDEYYSPENVTQIMEDMGLTSEIYTPIGTNDGEVIWGTDGADNIIGNGGNDLIFADPDGQGAFGPPDQAQGGEGDDVIVGSDQADHFYGMQGSDIIVSLDSSAIDSIYGGHDPFYDPYNTDPQGTEDTSTDVAIFSQASWDYTVFESSNSLEQGDNGDRALYLNANDGSDDNLAYDIEEYWFTDGRYEWDGSQLVWVGDLPTVEYDLPQSFTYSLDIDATFVDLDNSEIHSVTVSGLADGVLLSAGSYDVATGTWSLSPSELSGLTMTVPVDTADFNVTVTARAEEQANGDFQQVSQVLNVSVPDLAPVAGDSVVNGIEDTTVVFSSSDFNFTDPEGDGMASITVQSLETTGTLRLNGVDVSVGDIITQAQLDAGALTFEPQANDFGNSYDAFEFTVNDASSTGSDSATMTINIAPVNDAPEFLSGTDTASTPANVDVYTLSADEGTTADTTIGSVTAIDADGDDLTYSITGGNTGGLFEIDAQTGAISVTRTVADTDVGSHSLTVSVTDNAGGVDTATVNIALNDVNNQPVALDDTVTIAADSGATVIDVLSNDTDADSDSLTVTAVTQPTHGTVTLLGGVVSYTPEAGFTGTDTFTYTVSDGNGGTDTGTVTVGVPELNDNYGEVYEEAMLLGSNPSSPNEETTGNLLGDDAGLPNGLTLDVNIVGGTVDNSAAGLSVITTAENNVLTVNTDSSSANFGDYTYTLLQPLDHVLTEQDFTNGPEGWSGSGVSEQGDRLRLNQDATATQTFTYADMAGQEVVVEFDLEVSNGWDTSGNSQDYFNITANGTTVYSISPSGGSSVAVSVPVTLDANGQVTLALNANTTANSERAFVDNFSVHATELTDTFTYTLSDGAGFSDSANLNIVIHDDLADTPRDYNESHNINEDQDVSAGDFNLLDNATPQSGSTVESVSDVSIFINGSDASSDFTVTSGSTGSGEVARYTFVHNATYASAELVVYENGEVTWENGYTNLLDFMSPGDMAQLQIGYTSSVGGVTDTSTATVNISGVNDGPVAVVDSGLTSGGFASEFWVYNQGVDGPNLASIAQVIGFSGSTDPDATFISTGFNYSVVRGDSNYSQNQNLGTDDHLENWLADGGDDGSVIRNTSESSGDAIVRFAGAFEVESDGTYTLDIRHDDGFIVFIDGVETFTADFITAPSQFEETTFLTAGTHDVEIYYWDQGGEYVFDGSLYDSSGSDLWTPANVSYRGVPISTDEDESVNIDVLANDWDPEGDSLTVIGVTDGSFGTVTTNGNSVTYSPNAGFFGLDSFTYTISDGNGGTDTVTVPVEVRPENNPADIDLDGDDSSGKDGSDYYTADPLWNPINVVDSDVSITDIDGSNLFSAQIQITNPLAGDVLIVDESSLPSSIGFSYNAGSGIGLLSGFATIAEYEAALELVQLDNDNSNLVGDRVVEISVNDGNDQSAVATSTIRVTNNRSEGNSGDDTIDNSWATTQTVAISGKGGDDTLTAGSLNDSVMGGAGDDTLIGGAGDDVLVGGVGADTFAWQLTDQGTVGAPAQDVVLDFNGSQNDVLDLSDLLQGEEASTDLSEYLHFETSGGDTVVHVSSNGGYSSGYDAAQTDQTITLEGVSLTGSDDNDIINQLITNGQLHID
ncbi:tandem-95 repeat protein, partial [Gilvimarinus agarilyticus]|uniref:Ig-like domain-containing protein n=1 Tax=Gilvimarinus sp. 2_MG-2023 TaxID=3062666 RepID=UPI001C0825EA